HWNVGALPLGQPLPILRQQGRGNIHQDALPQGRLPPIELERLHIDRGGAFSWQDFMQVTVYKVSQGMTLCLCRLEVSPFQHSAFGSLRPLPVSSQPGKCSGQRWSAFAPHFDTKNRLAVVGGSSFNCGHSLTSLKYVPWTCGRLRVGKCWPAVSRQCPMRGF